MKTRIPRRNGWSVPVLLWSASVAIGVTIVCKEQMEDVVVDNQQTPEPLSCGLSHVWDANGNEISQCEKYAYTPSPFVIHRCVTSESETHVLCLGPTNVTINVAYSVASVERDPCRCGPYQIVFNEPRFFPDVPGTVDHDSAGNTCR